MEKLILESSLKNTTKPLLDENQTIHFINEFEIALNAANFLRIYCLIGEMGLEAYSKETRFHNLNENFYNFFWNNGYVKKILKIEPFETKCFSCDFGKKSYAIRISYLNDENVINTSEIAIKLDVKENKLMCFKYCKRFLKFEEIKQLA